MRACDSSSEMMHSLCSSLSYCSAPPKVIVEPRRGTLQVETKLTGENSTYQHGTCLKWFSSIKRLCLHVLYSLTSDSYLRYPSSSQDSGSSSLNIEKPRVDRRKRLVRQFSLWVNRRTIVFISWSLLDWTIWPLLIYFICPIVTIVMKMTSPRHLQPSPPSAVRENPPQTAPWTNRSNHPYTHR